MVVELMMPDDYPRRYPLLDQDNRRKLPKLYENEDKGLDAQAIVKFFTPDSNWTWYASEFDGDDLFFGLVVGSEIELGYFSLSELESAKGALGLPVECDLHFDPKTLKELMEFHRRQRSEGSSFETEAAQSLAGKLGRFAKQLAEWDKRIIEVVAIGELPNEPVPPDKAIQLFCTFDTPPKSDSEAYFSIANLLVRADDEGVYEKLNLVEPIDLGFLMGNKVFLPNGYAVMIPDRQTKIWSREDDMKSNG